MADKEIRFIDPHYKPLFTIPDGGSIVLTRADGEQIVSVCKYVDSTHFSANGHTYHICQWAEIQEKNGSTVVPEITPEYNDVYRIVERKPAGDFMIVMGRCPRAQLQWATWQVNPNVPGEYAYAIGRADYSDASSDSFRRALSVQQGHPAPSDKAGYRQIRFLDEKFRERFTIPDGGNVVLSYKDGDQSVVKCTYINEFHFHLGDTVYHVDELVGVAQRAGFRTEPETLPEIVEGYHIVEYRQAGERVIKLGHNPNAPTPWVTWQGYPGRPGDVALGNYYKKGRDAQVDLERRAKAAREGRPYAKYLPPKPKKDKGAIT
jgi:hypothetical protein